MPVFDIICAIDRLQMAKRKAEIYYDDKDSLVIGISRVIKYLDNLVEEDMKKEDPLK